MIHKMKLQVDGIEWEILIDIPLYENTLNIFEHITNKSTGEIFLPATPTFNWIVAVAKLRAVKMTFAEAISAKEALILKMHDEAVRRQDDEDLIRETMVHNRLPGQLKQTRVYKDHTNIEVLKLWGIKLGRAGLSKAKLPAGWTLVQRPVFCFGLFLAPLYVCL